MKFCAACHTDLPKESYSKKQWKLDEYQRRCKVCIANNREVQPIYHTDPNTNQIIKSLDSMYLASVVEKKISDEELFKQPPPAEDCPICFLRLPFVHTGYRHFACCGKTICCGCCYAPVYDNQGNEVDNEKCPFCRTPTPDTDEEAIERERKRVDAGDAVAIFNLGFDYKDGSHGMPQNYTKALKHWHRAAELGYSEAYNSIGYAYNNGEGLEVDEKKANHFYELSAMGGNATARYNLGNDELLLVGNMDKAIKHWMIAARDGYSESLKPIKDLYTNGYATKEAYTQALQSYQTYLGEIKSKQRDEAAAAYEDYRYY